MTSCLLFINLDSGRGDKLLKDKTVVAALSRYFDRVDVCLGGDLRSLCVGYKAVAICGGDGTLNVSLNSLKGYPIDVIYIPCGTLNDMAKSLGASYRIGGDTHLKHLDLGEANGTVFAYVLAGGTFTEIGYSVDSEKKKRHKVFAYLGEVLRCYKVRRIAADIAVGEEKYSGEYSLIMAINSERCFGFSFNRLYEAGSGKAHLLLIRAPKSDGLLGKIALFFPFFRAFFIGFGKQTSGKRIVFKEFSDAALALKEPTDFTVDGEKITLSGDVTLKINKEQLPLYYF